MPRPSVLDSTLMAQGRFLRLENLRYEDRRGVIRHWETTFRQNDQNAAVVIGILRPSNRLLLVRQFRPPLNAFAVEFPAGLVNAGEEPAQTAIRELKEETGYTGTVIASTGLCASSAGLTAEMLDLFMVDIDESLPENLNVRQSLDEGEDIQVLRIPLSSLLDTLRRHQQDGDCIDSRLAAWTMALTCQNDIILHS